MATLITTAQFADQCGLTEQETATALRGRCQPAVQLGGLIDADHSTVISFMENLLAANIRKRRGRIRRENKALDRPVGRPVKKDSGGPIRSDNIPDDIRVFLDMSFREVIDRFAIDERFVDWLKAAKEIENIHRVRLDSAAKEGTLVSRELVKVGVISEVEMAMKRLLDDGAKTIARQAVVLHKAGKTEAIIIKDVRSQVSAFIKNMKSRINRNLRKI